MSRLCRLGLLAVIVAGVGSPAPSEAGVIPSLYASMFGQFGFDSGYVPYYTGYTPYYAGYYGYGVPYTTSYAPYSARYGCSTCQASPCSNCGTGCATGNCATGNCASGNCGTGGCATTANSAPNGNLQPVPDPANSSRNLENRLQVIERHLHITPPATNNNNNTNGNRTYGDDGFQSVPSGRGNRNGNNTTIPNRGNGNTGNDGFDPPVPADNRDNGGMFKDREQERQDESLRRIPLPGDPAPEGSVIPSKKPAAAPAIDDKTNGSKAGEKSTQTLPLDSQMTSRAVSPRERQAISVGPHTTVVSARKPASKMQVDAQPQTINVARN